MTTATAPNPVHHYRHRKRGVGTSAFILCVPCYEALSEPLKARYALCPYPCGNTAADCEICQSFDENEPF